MYLFIHCLHTHVRCSTNWPQVIYIEAMDVGWDPRRSSNSCCFAAVIKDESEERESVCVCAREIKRTRMIKQEQTSVHFHSPMIHALLE